MGAIISNGIIFSGGGSATSVSYDNKLSGLSSTDVQGAIDELAGAATVDITEEEYLANKDVYDASDNIYFTSDDSEEDYVIFASEVYMDESKTQTVKAKIESAIGDLTFSVNGNNLVITDGNKTWTLTSS